MNKQSILKVLNVFLLFDFLCLLVTVLLNETLPKEVFFKIHPIFGSILLFLVVAHLVLNWSWIKNSYIKRKK